MKLLKNLLGRTTEQYRRSIRVADVMTTAIVSLRPNDTFDAAIEAIIKRNHRYLVVADDQQKVIGLLSEKDIVGSRWHISEWHSKRVRQIMAPNPTTVTSETLLAVAISIMISKELECVPVVTDSGTLCGMLTTIDIMKSHQRLLATTEYEPLHRTNVQDDTQRP